MPLPKKFVHQLPVMLEPRQYEHVLKVADGGSQAQVVRDALDTQISIVEGELCTIPAEELRELQRKADQFLTLSASLEPIAPRLPAAMQQGLRSGLGS